MLSLVMSHSPLYLGRVEIVQKGGGRSMLGIKPGAHPPGFNVYVLNQSISFHIDSSGSLQHNSPPHTTSLRLETRATLVSRRWRIGGLSYWCEGWWGQPCAELVSLPLPAAVSVISCCGSDCLIPDSGFSNIQLILMNNRFIDYTIY